MDPRRKYQVRSRGGAGAEQGLGLLARRGVPQQQPADGDRGLAGVNPDGCVEHILQAPHRRTVPSGHLCRSGVQTVAGSVNTVCREGRRAPLRRSRPGGPGARGGTAPHGSGWRGPAR